MGSPALPQRIALDAYPPGVYQAVLDVWAQDQAIVTRYLRFAKLGPVIRHAQHGARAFGITIDPAQRGGPAIEDRAVRGSGVRSLKLPVWTGLPADPPTRENKVAYDRWLQLLVKDGFALTGVLAGVPSELLNREAYCSHSLVGLLSEQPSLWEPSLSALVAPYASTFRAWQVGPDNEHLPVGSEKLSQGVEHLRTAMRRFVTTPYLLASVSAEIEPAVAEPMFDQLCIQLSSAGTPARVPRQVDPFRSVFSGKLSVVVPFLSAERFERNARLAAWAQRLIAARHAGVETVYVPQPWTVRPSTHGPIAEPREEYLILRTLVDVLGDARPGQTLPLSSSVQAYAFDRGDSVILALWDSEAAPGGSTMALQLGAAARQIDIFGVSTPVVRDEKRRHLVRLSSSPTLIDNVDPWIAEFYGLTRLTPDVIESSGNAVTVTIELPNAAVTAGSGRLALRAPENWNISPRIFDVVMMPGRTQKLTTSVRVPHNAPAGPNQIVVELTQSDGLRAEIPLPVSTGLSDVWVTGSAWLVHGDLMLRHVVHNRSSGTLHFRGSALVPGRERQYRPLANLLPGESQVVEYKFRECSNLVGSPVRVELRETNDGQRFHTLEMRVP